MGDEPEEMPPRVRSDAVIGRQDGLLDKAVAEVTAHTDGLRDAADRLRPLVLRAYRGVFELDAAPKVSGRRTPKSAIRQAELQALLDHLSEAGAGPAPAPAAPDDRWRPSHLAVGWRGLELGKLQALWILLVNALRSRGIDYLGSTELVRTRSRRAEPFAGLRHALAVAYGVSDPGESSPIPKHAMAKFKLPRGPVFGQIACKPTREYPSWAKSSGLDTTDIEDAIRDARVGARTYYEHGEHKKDPGRPLLHAEIELLRLVDAGEERDHAIAKTRKTKRGDRLEISRLAVEQLTPREALAKVRHLEGAPKTEHEARLMLKAARKAIRRVLEDRGLIPSIVGSVDPDADLGPEARKVRKRSQTSPFTKPSAA